RGHKLAALGGKAPDEGGPDHAAMAGDINPPSGKRENRSAHASSSAPLSFPASDTSAMEAGQRQGWRRDIGCPHTRCDSLATRSRQSAKNTGKTADESGLRTRKSSACALAIASKSRLSSRDG